MRTVFLALASIVVITLAFWAYRENYETQTAMKKSRDLQQQISSARERLRVLNAEWAYLNRPERLRDLADMNFARLGLLPLEAYQFSMPDQIPYPPKEVAANDPWASEPEANEVTE